MSKRSKGKKKRSDGKNGSESGSGTEPNPNSLAEWTKSLVVAAVLFLVLRTFIVQTFVITSGSMEQTLLVGDMLVVNRAAIGSRVPLTDLRIPGYSEPRRGDVIVFKNQPHLVWSRVKPTN